jgi:molybdopterin-containing oxidoreductase family membrane subunit
MTTTSERQRNIGGTIWLGVVILLTLVGVAAWIVLLVNGMGMTDLSNVTIWGLNIAGFIFFIGVSAGSLVLASLPFIFDLPTLRPYAKIATYVALAAIIISGLFILTDIGKPIRLWHLVAYGRLGSPMLWDLIFTIVILIISTVFLRRLIQSEASGKSVPKWLAYIALVAGLVEGLTAFVFATQIAHEFWLSAVQPIAFSVAALASAGALIMLLMVILKRTGYVALDCCELKPLAILTGFLLAINLFLVFSEAVTLAFSQSATALDLMGSMLRMPMFWVEVGALLVAIVLLFVPNLRENETWLSVGSFLALLGLAAKRMVFVRMAFAEPNITYPGVEVVPLGYTPSLMEWGLVVGLIALFVLLVTIGLRSLPLKVTGQT